MLQFQELLAFGGGRAASFVAAPVEARRGAPALWEWSTQVRDALDSTRLQVYHGWVERIAWLEVWQFTLVRRTRNALSHLAGLERRRVAEFERDRDLTLRELADRRRRLEAQIATCEGVVRRLRRERDGWARIQESIARTRTFETELAVLCTELDRRRARPLRI